MSENTRNHENNNSLSSAAVESCAQALEEKGYDAEETFKHLPQILDNAEHLLYVLEGMKNEVNHMDLEGATSMMMDWFIMAGGGFAPDQVHDALERARNDK